MVFRRPPLSSDQRSQRAQDLPNDMISAGLTMGKTIPPLPGRSSGYLEGSSTWLPVLL